MAPRKRPRYHIDASVGLSEEDKDILRQLGGLGTAPVPALQPAPPPGPSRADLYAAADEDQLAALMEDTGAPDYAARQAAGEISPDAPPNMAYYDQAPQGPATDEESAAYMRATGKSTDDRPPQERENARANFDPASAARNGYNGQIAQPQLAQQPSPQRPQPRMNWEDELLNVPNQQPGFNWGAAIAGGIAGLEGGPQAAAQTTLGVNAARQRALAQQQQNAVARAHTIQQGQALENVAGREARYMAALEQRERFEQGRQGRHEDRYGLDVDKFGYRKEHDADTFDQRERFQDRVDARQRRQIEYGERGPQRHAEGIRLDPVKRDAARTEYASIAMPLKDAIGAYQYLEKTNPQLLERFAQVGTSGKLGMLTQLEVSPGEQGDRERVALAQLDKLMVKEGFGTGGKSFTNNERSLISSFTGVPMGPGFNPFQSPKVLKDFMRGLNEVRRLRKRSIETSFGADIWER